MTDGVAGKIKDAFDDILRDRKTLVKILSVLLILLVAAVLKICDSTRSDITIESAETAGDTGAAGSLRPAIDDAGAGSGRGSAGQCL